jgi:hypothetical protein
MSRTRASVERGSSASSTRTGLLCSFASSREKTTSAMAATSSIRGALFTPHGGKAVGVTSGLHGEI